VKVATKKFFTPLQTTNMDTYAPDTESSAVEEAVPGKMGRPPPIVLTSATNLIQLQKQLKGVAKQIFEFHSTKNRTRVITKGMVDFQSVKAHFESSNLSYSCICKHKITIIMMLPNCTGLGALEEEEEEKEG
jgi:hypothetical protein